MYVVLMVLLIHHVVMLDVQEKDNSQKVNVEAVATVMIYTNLFVVQMELLMKMHVKQGVKEYKYYEDQMVLVDVIVVAIMNQFVETIKLLTKILAQQDVII